MIIVKFLKKNGMDEMMMASSPADKRMVVCRSSMAERTRFL